MAIIQGPIYRLVYTLDGETQPIVFVAADSAADADAQLRERISTEHGDEVGSSLRILVVTEIEPA